MTEIKEMNSILKKVLERGIPVTHAEFHSHVNNSENVPETTFDRGSPTRSRKVEMWWINGDGLYCLQMGKFFIVPASTVKFAKFE